MTLNCRLVLIVEDEPIIGLALEDMLSAEGARVLLADRIDDAFDIVTSEPVEVAILDVNVHGIHSYELAGSLGRAGVPYIFATGYGDLSHPPEFASVPTITKPYNLKDIQHALRVAEQG